MFPRPLPTLATLLVAAAPSTAQEFHGQPVETPQLATGQLGIDLSRSIDEILTRPLVDTGHEDGSIWVRTRGQRVRFDAAGGSVYPAFGREAQREWPLHLRLAEASRGDFAFDLTTEAQPCSDGQRVLLDRRGMDEVYHLGLDGVEQTFVFDTLAGDGDLVVSLDVETDLRPVVDGERLLFEHASLGHVEYGTAFALDATGTKISIERTWTGDGIELRVPDAFVDGAVLPLTIDPVLSTFSNGFGTPDDRNADIAYAAASNEYVVVWEDYTSQNNSDVYLTTWDADLTTQGSTSVIESGSSNWSDPAAAYSYAYDRVLVAATVNPNTGNTSVMARLYDVAGGVNVGGAFQIAGAGSQKSDVDVGGSNTDIQNASHFCVVWSKDMPNNDHDVQYRVIHADGSMVTGVLDMGVGGDSDIQPSISTGLGDASLPGDFWTVVWVRDDNDNGKGQIMGRRVYYTGSENTSSDVFAISSAIDKGAKPTVTSNMTKWLSYSPDVEVAVIACEWHEPDVTRPSGFQSDIVLLLLWGEDAINGLHLTRSEDFDDDLNQRNPVIVTDGADFFVAYQEEDYQDLNGDQYDLYMAAGEIPRFFSSLPYQLALSERHVKLADSQDKESKPSLVTRWSGETGSTDIQGAAVWTRETDDDGFGQIEGAKFSYTIPQSWTARAVGRQYCDAQPNSIGADEGRTSSWMRIFGDQSLTNVHLVQVLDLPQNQFGLLLASPSRGFTANPGGSMGDLCLGGSVGRFVNQLQSSGSNGRIDVVLDPTAIPTANGTVAAQPGEEWNFQMWHRDMVNGQPTSNFSNACELTFEY